MSKSISVRSGSSSSGAPARQQTGISERAAATTDEELLEVTTSVRPPDHRSAGTPGHDSWLAQADGQKCTLST